MDDRRERTTKILLLMQVLMGLFAFAEAKCGRKPLDVIFVLDESGSISVDDFKKQLQFVQHLVDKFDIGPTGTRVGVETFASGVRTIIELGDGIDAAQLKKHIGKINQKGGSTKTHLALKRLREMFSTSSVRPGASRVAIVITDGESDDTQLTALEAKRVHGDGIQVFAIGVGQNVKRSELGQIASKSGFVFTVDDYKHLDSILSSLAVEACSETITCNRKPMDVIFVLDESSSISVDDFQKQLQFVQHLVDKFDIGPTGTRVGVETFASGVRTIIELGDGIDAAQLKKHINKINQKGGSTKTHLALKRLREMFSTSSVRPGASRVAIVITDGESDDTQLTALEAKRVHGDGIQVFAIGVGQNVKRSELGQIASKSGFVFTVDDYKHLDSILSSLAIEACSETIMCNRKPMDVIFVLDESSSISTEDFKKQLKFVQALVDKFDIGPTGTRVGVETFASGVRTIIELGDGIDAAQLKKHIDKINKKGGGTMTHLALKRLREMFSRSSVRPGASRVAIVITDGESKNPRLTALEAKRVHGDGIQVFAIGVGQNVVRSELDQIASKSGFVFTVDDYKHLDSIVSILAAEACVEPKTILPVDC